MRVSFTVRDSVRVIQVAILSCNCEVTQPRRKRNDRQRSPTAIMQTNSSMCMRVRINVVGVVLSIND